MTVFFLTLIRFLLTKTTASELTSNWGRFSGAQREQYFRSIFYYLTSFANMICLAAPMLFLFIAPESLYSSAVPVLPIILFRLLSSAWIYPLSMHQRGLPLKESIALMGFSLSSWERQLAAAYASLIRRKQGKFGVSRKEGPILKMDLRTSLGRRFYFSNTPFMISNLAAALYGGYMGIATCNEYYSICGLVGLIYSALLTFSWARYNKGANPLPPRNGKELLRIITENDNITMASYALKELQKEELRYSKGAIDRGKKIYGQRFLAT